MSERPRLTQLPPINEYNVLGHIISKLILITIALSHKENDENLARIKTQVCLEASKLSLDQIFHNNLEILYPGITKTIEALKQSLEGAFTEDNQDSLPKLKNRVLSLIKTLRSEA